MNYNSFSMNSFIDINNVNLNQFGIKDINKIQDLINELQTKKDALEAEKIERDRIEAENRREEEIRKAEETRKHREHIENVTSMDLSPDWNNIYNSSPLTEGVVAETIPDGYIKCLNNLGRVDIEYIAAITGADYKTVINSLKGSIYQNPETWNECFYKGWETADEYLSGNIRYKLEVASKANDEYLGYFNDNVNALSPLQPKRLDEKDIYITLGSPWIPVGVIRSFCAYISQKHEKYWSVRHDVITASWEVKYVDTNTKNGEKSLFFKLFTMESKYGSPAVSALNIIRKTLNLKSLSVYHTVEGKKVFNKSETIVAYEKQKLIVDEFKRWAWSDPARKKLLLDIYDKKYGSIKTRHFDGDFLDFPKMNKEISLYKYQKDAIARIIFSPNTLLAHEVGAGKTYIMIAAGMELIRMRLSKKNMYVVPNNILTQWKDAFMYMYPEAKVLSVSSNNFSPSKRVNTLHEIKYGSYDAIIIVYSCFNKIPISDFYKNKLIDEEINEIEEIMFNYTIPFSNKTKKLGERYDKLKNMKKELVKEKDEEGDNPYVGISFDDLGITRLFIDEAHNFKNVPINTKIENVMGINSTGSSKCRDMMDKVRIIQSKNKGKGVIMATGTPITNSITDAFIMQKYLQNEQLEELDLQHFDSWVMCFAEQITNFEIDVDTNSYRMATRFSEFHNIPELTKILSNIADFHKMDGVEGVPKHEGYNDVVINKTEALSEYLDDISSRVEDIRTGIVDRTVDNMLKVTTDGRKAALDLRLVNYNDVCIVDSKVYQCAIIVSDIYKKTRINRSTQLIFCDTSTPKNEFNIYSELRRLLIIMGVDEKEIAFVHMACSNFAKETLFKMVREGRVRILIGSTFKLGLGVNVQDKLIALHHLDVPWRPADMVQREGRILRQGNENSVVEIYRYITEGSFDAYSWQLLETKQRFITEILSGTESERDGLDVDETVLNYAEVKALAVGNELVKEKIETTNELSKYLILQNEESERKQGLELELSRINKREQYLINDIDSLKSDIYRYEFNKVEHKDKDRKGIRGELYKAISDEVNSKGNRTLMNYQGFDLVIPKVCSPYNPVVFLIGQKRYIVRLGDNAVGNLNKIDNKLKSLNNEYNEEKMELDKIRERREVILEELSKDNIYVDQIEQCRKILAKIDKELGI